MKKSILSLGVLLLFSTVISFSQNVAINITGAAANNSAMLDVNATDRGLLIPRVTLTATNSNAPIGAGVATSLMVYNTATNGAGATAVTPGYYWWDGGQWVRLLNTNGAWQIGGNYFGGTATGYIFGPMTNDHIDWYTNGVVRGRMSNLGEFFIGSTATALTGDLMNGIAFGAFPWAVNGYTTLNGAGVYGLRQAGATGTWGSGQFESTAGLAAGSRGVSGQVPSVDQYGSFGQKPAGGLGWGGLFYNDLGYTGFFGNASDRRLKKNINPVTNALNIISNISIYKYQYKTEQYDILGDDTYHYGVMADELKLVLPELVKTKTLIGAEFRSDPNANLRGVEGTVDLVNYLELIPISVEAIKELNTQVNDLQKENDELKARLSKLEQQILLLQK